MQFRRKRGQSGSRNATLRVALLLAGGIALVVLLWSNLREDDYTLLTTDRSYISRGDAPLENDQEHMHQQKHKIKMRAREMEMVGEEDSDSNSNVGVDDVDVNDVTPPPRLSLLNSPDAMKNIPSCEVVRHDLSSTSTFDESHPALFRGWNPPALQKWADREKFQSSFGSHVQYLKGRDVQPLKDKQGKRCRATTKSLIDAMAKLFRKKNPNFDNENENNGSSGTNTNTNNQQPMRMTEQEQGIKMDLLFFTNDAENPSFLEALSSDYSAPDPIANLDSFSNGNGFRVFSALERGSSHPFHYHRAAWLGQVTGSRLWYFLPPNTPEHVVGPKVNGCDYLLGRAPLPKGATACVQNQGEVMYFPSQWLHSTCALEPWSVGIGSQGGKPNVLNQKFGSLHQQKQPEISTAKGQKKMVECGVFDKKDFDNTKSISANTAVGNDQNQMTKRTDSKDKEDWTWYDGDLNEYYNKLERDEHAKRDPNVITSYAVHRWMGTRGSTLIHYDLVRETIYNLVIGQHAPPSQSSSKLSNPTNSLRVFDAGCGLGAGLMWFEQHEPNWQLVGHTISEEQHKWIVEDLPEHKFVANLHTYDEPLQGGITPLFNAVYSIEAAIHSPNLKHSLQEWSKALLPGGVIIIIDDFLSVGVARDDPDVDLFARSWIASAVHTTTEIAAWAEQMDMTLALDRDLGSEFQIIKRNYRNKAPELRDEQGRAHQGWLGSKVRQKLMVEGKISYRLIALQKKGNTPMKDNLAVAQSQSCSSVPTIENSSGGSNLSITIDPVLMTGKGNKGGRQMACISGWYCCDQGTSLWDEMEQKRTERTGFLQLPRELFGHYLTSFSKHLTDFYRTYPANYPDGTTKGVFLDIGGTGSVASGMTQVSSKFSNFAGPLDYWVLDSDPDAKKLSNAVVCDIDDCPEAADCGYDVTFSHTVLEHAARPWKSFDTVARITKKGGLTLHLVPWSYQYHATPDDNYRFSHKALTTLLEDRGFEVLDVGYDICTQPDHMLKNRKDEHFEKIWLTYVVGRKL